MSLRIKILASSAALLLASCGLFKANSSPAYAPNVQGTLIGVVDSAYNQEGTLAVGNAISVASRGDTLLVMGDNDLYTALPGQPLTRLHTAWETGNYGVYSMATTSPAFYGGFVGNRDSLYIADGSGEIWKVNKIGDPILTYPPETNGIDAVNARAEWVGSLDGKTGLALLEDGGAYRDTLTAGNSWTGLLPNKSVLRSFPFQIGDCAYFSPQNTDLVAISIADFGQRSFAAPGGGNRWNYIPCDSTFCAIDSTGFYRYTTGSWAKLKINSTAEYELATMAAGWVDAVQYQNITLLYALNSSFTIFAVVRGDNVVVRNLSDAGDVYYGRSHPFTIWNDNLVYTGGNKVLAIPMSEVLAWK